MHIILHHPIHILCCRMCFICASAFAPFAGETDNAFSSEWAGIQGRLHFGCLQGTQYNKHLQMPLPYTIFGNISYLHSLQLDPCTYSIGEILVCFFCRDPTPMREQHPSPSFETSHSDYFSKNHFDYDSLRILTGMTYFLLGSTRVMGSQFPNSPKSKKTNTFLRLLPKHPPTMPAFLTHLASTK